MEGKSALSLIETEIAIKYIKDSFETELSRALKLTRVSAPLFVFPETGLNDNLNGFERAVRFDVLALKKEVEIVQSLAKWKRMALEKYGMQDGQGLYTDMNAIRRDEDLDATHSIYVDRWDWEKIISKQQRTLTYLKSCVKKIYAVLKKVGGKVAKKYPSLPCSLPENIAFVSTEELELRYPDASRKERENLIAKEYGAVFIYGIGWPLKDGKPHDGRAADYDDWKMNGDILLWYDVLGQAFEISSMGVRVDGTSLVKQLEYKGEISKKENPYCQDVINGKLPLTIGGGIGQSRLCMFFLKKAHIGEVQASVWSESIIEENLKRGARLL